MKTTIFNRPRWASGQAASGLWASGAALTATLLLLATANLSAGTTNGVVVGSLCGGGYSPYYGYVEGDPITSTDAQFHTPIGLALDSTGEYLYVADRDNNAIRVVDLSSSSAHYNFTYTLFAPPNVITNPVGVALDADDNVYVLNRGNGNNGTVLLFDNEDDPPVTIASGLTNANAITLDAVANAYMTASNSLIRITSGGVQTIVATITNANACLQGVVVMDSGLIAACDSGRNGILLINPVSGVISNLTGFNGAGDNTNIWETTPNHPVTKATAMFNHPYGLAKAGNGMLIVADYGNNRVKAVNSAGTVTNLYGVSSNLWYKGSGTYPGWRDGSVVVPDAIGDIEARLPNGVLVAQDGSVYATEDYYHLIRHATGTGLTSPGLLPHLPLFRSPMGIALDTPGTQLYIADYGNNAVQVLDLHNNQTETFLDARAGILQPVDVVVDYANNLYVLNQGTGGNGSVLEFDEYGNVLRTNATGLAWPTALAVDNSGNLFVAQKGGAVRQLNSGSSSTLFTITNANVQLQGIASFDDGTVAVSDAGNHVIWQFNPATHAVTLLTGTPGVPGKTLGLAGFAKLNQPYRLARAAGNLLVAADYGNNRLVVVDRAGAITNVLNSTNASVWYGRSDDPQTSSGTHLIPMVSPVGVALGSDGGVYDSEAVYDDIRKIPSTGLLPPPLPLPVPDLQIGYVDFPAPSNTSVFTAVSSFVANNDVIIATTCTAGTETFFTAGPSPGITPSLTNGTQYCYPGDGTSHGQVPTLATACDGSNGIVTIEAIGMAPGRPSSAVVSAQFQFITANPLITGNNAAQLTISDITADAHLYYTLDGSDPSSTNGVDLGTVATPTNVWNVGFPIVSNTLFKVRAFRNCYLPSAIVNNSFSVSNYVPKSRIDPYNGYYPMGQTITVSSVNPSVYYTTDGSDPTTNSLSVTMSNNVGFIRWFNSTNDLRGLRVKAFNASGASETVGGQPVTTNTIGVPPDSNPAIYAGIGSQIVVPVVVNLQPNAMIQSYQFRVEIWPNGSAQPISSGFDVLNISTNDFIPLATVAQGGARGIITYQHYTIGSTNGLEIYAIGNTNNVSFQNFAVVALLRIAIPSGASEGDSYALAVSYPSATSDGVSAAVPLTPMAPATILVTNIAYKVGDSASISGGWYNAGGFGNGDLDNSDVNLVFYASVGERIPYAFSDVFNVMDAYPLDAAGFVGGDGQIRFLDWNVILQRSLRMDTNNWARAWSTNGDLVDVPTTLTASKVVPQVLQPKLAPTWPWYRQALIGAVSTGNAVPGRTVNVPVYVKLSDGATLSGVQFRAVVTPQGSAPTLTQSPQLSLASGVPGPTLQQSFTASDAGFGWALGSFNYLSRSSNFLGWVTFTIPATAQSGQTYAVSFANADGAPNLNAQYDFETRSACVAVGGSAPPASICSDEWKIHFFGSLANPIADDLADPDSDGVPNWMEYLAGTDPTDSNSRLQLSGAASQAGKAQSQMVIHWLTAPGKTYEAQWSSSLSGGSWSTLATVSGDGTVASCSDTNSTPTVRYYRLHVLP